jgi:hypothetical protein
LDFRLQPIAFYLSSSLAVAASITRVLKTFGFRLRFRSSSEHLSWCRREFFLPFSDAVASFLKIVSEGVQPSNPAVSLKPGELPFAELADGCSELKAQVVECPQLSAEIPRYIAVL